MKRPHRSASLVIVAFLTAAVAAFLIGGAPTGHVVSSLPGTGVRFPIDDIFDTARPLLPGESKGTFGDVKDAQVEVVQPTTASLPTDDKTADVWASDATGEVLARYGDSLLIDLSPLGSVAGAEASIVEQARLYGGYVITIDGFTTLVEPAGRLAFERQLDADTRIGALPQGTDTTIVTLIRGRTMVTLLGLRHTPKEVLEVASNLQPV